MEIEQIIRLAADDMKIEQIIRLTAVYFRVDRSAVSVQIRKLTPDWRVEVRVEIAGFLDSVCVALGQTTLKDALRDVHSQLQTWITKQQLAIKEVMDFEEKEED